MARTLKIFFHDNCFDGATSAALFAHFFGSHVSHGVETVLQPVQHCSGDPFEGLSIDADDNACVDFRFSPHPKMNWWFDHHMSAFQPAELFEVYESESSSTKFYDPAATSCAMFELACLKRNFHWEPHDPYGYWRELLGWADVIDSARFATAEEAADLSVPAKQVMTWLEHNRDGDAIVRLTQLLGHHSLADIARQDWVAVPLKGLLENHKHNIELIKMRSILDGGVVWFDLSEDEIEAHNKFIPYLLHPSARYSISMTRTDLGIKVSVGSNPWSSVLRNHNIARLCERFGGGGHPYVGAVSLPADQFDRAQDIVRQLREVLAADGG